MSAAATLEMPVPKIVGGYTMSEAKKNADERNKHSFDADRDVDEILRQVLNVGANKTKFINLCVRAAALEAYKALAEERTRAEQQFLRSLEHSNKGPKKRPPPSE